MARVIVPIWRRVPSPPSRLTEVTPVPVVRGDTPSVSTTDSSAPVPQKDTNLLTQLALELNEGTSIKAEVSAKILTDRKEEPSCPGGTEQSPMGKTLIGLLTEEFDAVEITDTEGEMYPKSDDDLWFQDDEV